MAPAPRHPEPRAAAAPRVYVLLLNWNGWRDTLECLDSLFRMHYPHFRVVVCDNASSDESVERIAAWADGLLAAPAGASPARSAEEVAKPLPYALLDRAEAERGGGGEDAPLVLVQNGSNGGFAAGNNVGLRYALARGADYVWLLNNDTVVAPDTLGELVAAAEADPGAGMVGAKLLFYDEPETIQAAAGGKLTRWNGFTSLYGSGEEDRGDWDRPLEPDYVHGASLLVRAGVAREVGLMDERYFLYSEEVDWSVRTRRAGWRLGYAHRARVWHKEGRTARQDGGVGREYHSTRSRFILIWTHYPRLLPLALAYSVYRTVLPKVVRRQPERARAAMRAYRDFFVRDVGSTGATTRGG